MKFRVWREGEDGIDPTVYDAFDAYIAAEMWAEDDDCCSAYYSIVRGDAARVWVQVDDQSSPAELFEVTGEVVPQYTAAKK